MFAFRLLAGLVLLLLTTPALFAEKHVAVIAPQPFHESLAPWIKHRTEQGWNVHVIVEPFGGATHTTPQRIKERIRALEKQTSLSAILLVGDAAPHQDVSELNRIVPSPLIPCRLIQYFGEEKTLASDDWYGDLDDDGIPELAVGRLSVTTSEQLDDVIRKTILFETEPIRVERRQIQLVAGVGNFTSMIDGSIEGVAKLALTELVPMSREISFLHLNWKSPFCPDPHGARREIVESLGNGSLFWAYLGHGLHRTLDPLHTPNGDIPTFTDEEIPLLKSPKGASIALFFCCYGGVPDASTDSLAEEMLRASDGPVAVVAASRTTMPYGMSVLGIELLRELSEIPDENENPTLGSVILAAKRRTVLGTKKQENSSDTPKPVKGPKQRPLRENVDTLAKMLDPFPERLSEQLLEHVALFNLFGDPLLKIPVPKKIELQCPETVSPGSSLRVEGTILNGKEMKGSVQIELVVPVSKLSLSCPDRSEFRDDEPARLDYQERFKRSNSRVLSTAEAAVDGGSFGADLKIPEGIRGDYVVRAVFCSETELAVGAATTKVKRN